MDTEHYVVEQGAPKWVQTALTSIGATCVGGLLLWIANTQVDVQTTQATILADLKATKQAVIERQNNTNERLSVTEDNVKHIWPRIRTHGENIEHLKHELEKVCKCEINLKSPDKF